MSLEERKKEGKRWLLQASDDLSAVLILVENSKYAQACFLGQQAGEKALKAVWHSAGFEPWGHSIAKLIDDFPVELMRTDLLTVRGEALTLDKLYIPTRYPNGLPELVPSEAYGRTDAESAISCATKIIELSEKLTKR